MSLSIILGKENKPAAAPICKRKRQSIFDNLSANCYPKIVKRKCVERKKSTKMFCSDSCLSRTIGSFTNDDTITIKMNSRFFKRRRD